MRRYADRGGIAAPSQITIAKLARVSVRTVIRALQQLIDVGAIVQHKDKSQPFRTVAAYVVSPALLSPNYSGYRLPRHRTVSPVKSLACVKHNKQSVARERKPIAQPVAKAVAELVAAGFSPPIAQRDVAAIGPQLVLRRLMQARSRPAFVRGVVANPVGYLRHCISRDYPPPADRSRILAPPAVVRERKAIAMAFAREEQRDRERRESQFSARSFMQQLRSRVDSTRGIAIFSNASEGSF